MPILEPKKRRKYTKNIGENRSGVCSGRKCHRSQTNGRQRAEETENNISIYMSFVCFVALSPKSTAMVIAGRSVYLTTLFPGQA